MTTNFYWPIMWRICKIDALRVLIRYIKVQKTITSFSVFILVLCSYSHFVFTYIPRIKKAAHGSLITEQIQPNFHCFPETAST